jgi:hypothetical protein
MIPPMWSMWAWVGMTASMSLGSIPDCEMRRQPAHGVGALDRAHPGLEQRELVAGIDHEDVLIQHHIVGRQEMVAHHPAELLRGRPAKGILRVADRERSVRHHRRLDGSELEAIEGGRRRVEHRRLGVGH